MGSATDLAMTGGNVDSLIRYVCCLASSKPYLMRGEQLLTVWLLFRAPGLGLEIIFDVLVKLVLESAYQSVKRSVL